MVGHHQRVQRLSVVPYSSKRLHRVMVVVVVAGYLLVGWAGYWGGYNKVRIEMARSEESVERLSNKNEKLAESVQNLRSEGIQKQQELVLERQTIELIRQENMGLQSRVNALEQEVAFFHRVVKTSDDAQGVAFGQLHIEPLSAGQYEIKVDMMQISGRKKISGKLYLNLEGFDREGKKQAVELPVLLDDTDQGSDGLPLSFVSFQTVVGTVAIPESITPRTLLLTARITKGKQVHLEKRFPWQVD